MHIEIPSTAEALVLGRARAAGFSDVSEHVYSLILQDVSVETPAETRDQQTMDESLARLDRGMEDIAAGRTLPAKEAMEQIAAEFGLTIVGGEVAYDASAP